MEFDVGPSEIFIQSAGNRKRNLNPTCHGYRKVGWISSSRGEMGYVGSKLCDRYFGMLQRWCPGGGGEIVIREQRLKCSLLSLVQK